MKGKRIRAGALLAAVLSLGTAPVQAQETVPPPAADASLARARTAFLEGVGLVQGAQWAEALSKFEESASLRKHATTLFNIGACERALGRYTRARAALRAALERGRGAPDELPESLAAEATAFVDQIEALLARLEVVVSPVDAAVAVDGRPLQRDTFSAGGGVWVAGVAPPGSSAAPLSARLVLLVDPGVHLITISRQGFGDAVLNRTFAPAARGPLRLELERLPATIHVSSNRERALVKIGDTDVGPVPVDVLRPSGSYSIVVRETGYLPYETNVNVRAGEQVNLTATLTPEHQPITRRWWFWTGAVAVVAGGVALTYALTRPEPQPPPYDGGNRNWVVFTQGQRF